MLFNNHDLVVLAVMLADTATHGAPRALSAFLDNYALGRRAAHLFDDGATLPSGRATTARPCTPTLGAAADDRGVVLVVGRAPVGEAALAEAGVDEPEEEQEARDGAEHDAGDGAGGV